MGQSLFFQNLGNDKYKKPTLIGDILTQNLKKVCPQQNTAMTQIWAAWEKSINPLVQGNAKPYAFQNRNKILIAHVSCSSWLMQLRFIKDEILTTLNSSMEDIKVKEIRMKIGHI